MSEEFNKSRKNFLGSGLKMGIITLIGGYGLTKLFKARGEGSDGEKVEVMTASGEMLEIDASQLRAVEKEESSYDVREGFTDKKFVMVIDLAKCKNAKKCVSSCSKMHHVTGENAWLKVYKMQDSEETSPYWQPTLCQHCDKPPCVKVCPVDATFKRRDGIVLIDNDRCIGCRFCMAACPYSTRVFNWEEPLITDDEACASHNPENGQPPQMGTVSKCDFCPDMVAEGKLPDCVTACPNGVFYFGDKYEDTVTNGEETHRLSTMLKDRAGYRILEELGTEPNVYYLPPVDRLEDFEDGLENYVEYSKP
jgi:molybdopterin-containing oxidoreductase family iron-sulfur binding subunit